MEMEKTDTNNQHNKHANYKKRKKE